MNSKGSANAPAPNQGECDKLDDNANKSEAAFDHKRHFLIAPRLPDIAHRRIREQLSKAIRFLEAGDLDNCRTAVLVALEWTAAAEGARR
jgi:hypothetical protein